MSSAAGIDTYSHPKSSFERLNGSNYASWKNNIRRLLRMIRAWDITEGREQLPPLPSHLNSQSVAAVAARARREDFEQRRKEAAGIIYNACIPAVRVYIDDSDDPADMWITLAERMDTANTAIGRQALYKTFMTLRPAKGRPIGEYLASLLEIKNQLSGTPEEISDIACKMHIFTSLPDVFAVTLKIQQNRPDATIVSIIDALKEDEKFRMMKTTPDAATEVFYSDGARGGQRGGSRGGRRRSRVGAGNGSLWCSHCNTRTHSLEDCWSKGRTRAQTSVATPSTPGSTPAPSSDLSASQVPALCWHCGDEGHRQAECPIKLRGDMARAGGLPEKRRKLEQADGQFGEREEGAGF